MKTLRLCAFPLLAGVALAASLGCGHDLSDEGLAPSGGTAVIGTATLELSGGKVTICHGTASATNPYVKITVSQSAAAKHLSGHGRKNNPDFRLDSPEGSCSQGTCIPLGEACDDASICCGGEQFACQFGRCEDTGS